MPPTKNERHVTGRRLSHHRSAWLAVSVCVTTLVGTSCVTFDEYPEGRLCKDPFRDSEGRAIFYPESAICPPELDAGPEPTPAASAEDGGIE